MTTPQTFPKIYAYIVPFAAYLLATQALGEFPDLYPYLYGASVFLVAIITIVLLRKKEIITPHKNIAPGIIVGIIGIGVWIGIASLHLEDIVWAYIPEWLIPHDRPAFNPFIFFDSAVQQWGFISVRIIGIALLVPIIEEIFWRGFLLRWVIGSDWEKQPIGIFTPQSFLWVVFLFTLAHPEWFAALVYCSILNALLYWKKDLWNCIVAHSVSNFSLAIYVITTESWQLW